MDDSGSHSRAHPGNDNQFLRFIEKNNGFFPSHSWESLNNRNGLNDTEFSKFRSAFSLLKSESNNSVSIPPQVEIILSAVMLSPDSSSISSIFHFGHEVFDTCIHAPLDPSSFNFLQRGSRIARIPRSGRASPCLNIASKSITKVGKSISSERAEP